ncbi:hypothetical protein [Roseomonas haemaphysalidis]|uniref:hypothetical protein n=1 Tax=Roseomonas haemaphysalidis TaxID=2768162 RepID=UPI001A97C956|nr:hypothetical protein [Roseomonas haemaphysalidis]
MRATTALPLLHPNDPAARAVIRCQVALQRVTGGDTEIGQQLYPLLAATDLHSLRVSPHLVYVDVNRPELVDGFIRRTFTAIVASVRDEAVRTGQIEAGTFDTGIQALHRTTEGDGTFCYTFFKATALREG